MAEEAAVEMQLGETMEVETTTTKTQEEDGNGKREREEEDRNNGVSKKPKLEEVKQGLVSLGPRTFESSVEMFDYFFKFLHYWPTNVDVNQHVSGEGDCFSLGESLFCNNLMEVLFRAQRMRDFLDLAEVAGEMQLAENEQATYASANNDLRGTKAYQEADVPGLYNLAMAIVDYRSHRVIAQSVLPSILQGDKSDSLLYGSVDNGKKICWDEDFHFKVAEAAKRLHLSSS